MARILLQEARELMPLGSDEGSFNFKCSGRYCAVGCSIPLLRRLVLGDQAQVTPTLAHWLTQWVPSELFSSSLPNSALIIRWTREPTGFRVWQT